MQRGRELTSSNCQATVEVVDESPDGCVEMERNPVGRDEPDHGNQDDQGAVKPVHVLWPVGPGHGKLGDVHFALVLLDLGNGVASEWDVVGGAVGKGRGLLGGGRYRRHGGWFGVCRWRREVANWTSQHRRQVRGEGPS